MKTSDHLASPFVAIMSNIGTRLLLYGGVAVAPVFLLVTCVQIFVRSDFDITRHAVSALQNGSFGWVQSGNFIVTGLLSLLFAWEIWKILRGSAGQMWAPILILTFGAGMIIAGLFPPDPAFGFPAGASAGSPDVISVSGGMHSAGFFGAFTALGASSFVLARHFRRLLTAWSLYSLIVGVVTPILIARGIVFTQVAGTCFLAAGVMAFTWLSAIALRLIKFDDWTRQHE